MQCANVASFSSSSVYSVFNLKLVAITRCGNMSFTDLSILRFLPVGAPVSVVGRLLLVILNMESHKWGIDLKVDLVGII